MDQPLFSPIVPRILPLQNSRSSSRSPTRQRPLSDDILSDLTPENTIETLKNPSGRFRLSIQSSSPEDRTFGIHAAIASKKIKEWVEEVSGWPWPKEGGSAGFEVSPAKRRKLSFVGTTQSGYTTMEGMHAPEHLGSLTEPQVYLYETRIDEIHVAMEDLNFEEIKRQVLDTHFSPVSRPSSSGSNLPMPSFFLSSYTRMDDFTALITATVLQALPNLSKLMRLLDAWTVRLAVLRMVPPLNNDLEDVEILLKRGWVAIQVPKQRNCLQSGALGESLSRESFNMMRDVLRDKVTKLGRNLDFMLDTLEGQPDNLPDSWLERMETIEHNYGEWVVAGDRRVREGEWAKLAEAQNHAQEAKRIKDEAGAAEVAQVEAKRDASEEEFRIRAEAEATTAARMKAAEADEAKQKLPEDVESITPTDEAKVAEALPMKSKQDCQEIEVRTVKKESEAAELTRKGAVKDIKNEVLRKSQEADDTEAMKPQQAHEGMKFIKEAIVTDVGNQVSGDVSVQINTKASPHLTGIATDEVALSLLKFGEDGNIEFPRQKPNAIHLASPNTPQDLNDLKFDHTSEGAPDQAEILQTTISDTLLESKSTDCFEPLSEQLAAVPAAATDTMFAAIAVAGMGLAKTFLPKSRSNSPGPRLDYETTRSSSHICITKKDFGDAIMPRISNYTPFDGTVDEEHEDPINKLPEKVTYSVEYQPKDQIRADCFFTQTKQLVDAESLFESSPSTSPNNRASYISTLGSSVQPVPDPPGLSSSSESIGESNHSSYASSNNDRFGNQALNVDPTSIESAVVYLDSDAPAHSIAMDGCVESWSEKKLEDQSDDRAIRLGSLKDGYKVTKKDPIEEFFQGLPHEMDLNYAAGSDAAIITSSLTSELAPYPRKHEPLCTKSPTSITSDGRPLLPIPVSDTDDIILTQDSPEGSPVPSELQASVGDALITSVPETIVYKSEVLTTDESCQACDLVELDIDQIMPEIEECSTLPGQSSLPSTDDISRLVSTHRRLSVSSDASTVITSLPQDPSVSPIAPQTPEDRMPESCTDIDEPSPLAGRIAHRTSKSYDISPPDSPLMSAQRPRALSLLKSPVFHTTDPFDPSKLHEAPMFENLDVSSAHIPTSPKKANTDDQMQQQISSLLESIPARIRLTNDSCSIPFTSDTLRPHKPRRSITPSFRPNSSMSNYSTSSQAVPSFTLAPAYAKGSSRPRHQVSNPEIKVYHLSRSTGETPIKLFVRLVGEHGERVMVRVGGGWADLGEYLKEYASHHGRRTVMDSGEKVEVHDITPRIVSSSSTTSISTIRASGRSSPVPRPHSVMERERSRSSLNVRKTRKSVGESSIERSTLLSRVNDFRSPSTPLPTSNRRPFDTPPSAASSTGTAASVASGRSSRMSWGEEDSSLGLAGPKGKKVAISDRDQEWIESMKEKVRLASVEKERKDRDRSERLEKSERGERMRGSSFGDMGDSSFGEMEKVGGTKRLFRKGSSIT